MLPSPDEVRAQLERILASSAFANAGRVSRLLRYVVERTLAGEGDQLKEYVLGVEVFDRGDTYDPRIDSIVRVEARRLRAKLEEYYQGPGASDPVIIGMRPGGYAPTFGRPDTPLPVSDRSTDRPIPVHSYKRQVVLTALAFGILGLVMTALWARSMGAREASSGIRIAVLPFAHFSTEPAVAMVAARITDGVTSNLAREQALSVVSRMSAAQFTSDEKPVREVASALDADLVMEGSVVVEAGGVHVVARIVNASIDRKVWVAEYDSPPDQLVDLNRRIATEAAQAALKLGTARPR